VSALHPAQQRDIPSSALAGGAPAGPQTRRIWPRPERAGPPRPEGHERRAIRRALADWERLCADGAIPVLTELSPLRSPIDWTDRFLLACDREPARSVFVLCGARVEAAFERRIIGRTLGEIAARQGGLVRACAQAMREQRPCEVEDVFRNAARRLVLYRAVFLPVRSADGCGAYLMGAYGCTTVMG
jgi:hypothetical protein